MARLEMLDRSVKMSILLVVTLLATSCGASIAAVAKSDLSRETSPEVTRSDWEALAEGNRQFAFDLYHGLSEGEGNLVFSPYSISLALAMAYAGARGETESEMATTLHFTLPQERFHPAFNALDLRLSGSDEGEGDDGFQLNISNAMWGQADFQFLPEFLDVLARNYGAGMRLVDFVGDGEGARNRINDWASDETEGRIKDLIPEGGISDFTRLILTNAIYFNAEWEHPFEKHKTLEGTFRLIDGSEVAVAMMEQREMFSYFHGEDVEAIELPYLGGSASMLILLPEEGRFEAFEESLNSVHLDEILESLTAEDVQLSLPKFSYESDLKLVELLSAMGMPSAFVWNRADFSGMDGSGELFIGSISHKAYVRVDEKGTEAAAATEITAEIVSLPTMMKVDHPFLFLIREVDTGTILFLGKVMNPAEGEE